MPAIKEMGAVAALLDTRVVFCVVTAAQGKVIWFNSDIDRTEALSSPDDMLFNLEVDDVASDQEIALLAESAADADFAPADSVCSRIPNPIPTDGLKSALRVLLKLKGKRIILGKKYLLGMTTSGHGVFVVDGTLSRAVYRALVREAVSAGLPTQALYVYSEYATYSGPGIKWNRLSETHVDISLLRN